MGVVFIGWKGVTVQSKRMCTTENFSPRVLYVSHNAGTEAGKDVP